MHLGERRKILNCCYVPQQKDDGSNYTDWVRNLRIILIVAQKKYVLEAPLGDRPIAGPDADVTDVLQAWYDDYYWGT